jgi:hypothetical protein
MLRIRVVGSWDGECVAAVNSIPCHKSPFQFVNKSASKALTYVSQVLTRNTGNGYWNCIYKYIYRERERFSTRFKIYLVRNTKFQKEVLIV